MKFSLHIDSRDAAMQGSGRREVARLLRKAAEAAEQGREHGRLLDFNGNCCGEWELDDEKPDFFEMEAADLFEFADAHGVALDDDPRDLSRAELIEGLESICVACYDHESDEILAAAYGDSMLAGDLGNIDRTSWPDACDEEWQE